MEFEKFAKIARYSRDCIITEKIDGTNAQIYIGKNTSWVYEGREPVDPVHSFTDGLGNTYGVWAGSRKQWVSVEKDNHGFARWVKENAEALWIGLGEGRHYGEWWGSGINRNYGLSEKRFSLFNTVRWDLEMFNLFKIAPWQNMSEKDRVRTPEPIFKAPPKCCHVTPVLHSGPFDTREIERQLNWLMGTGSRAAPGYSNPEGIVIYHTHGNMMFKKTIEDDDKGKKYGA
jgi:hypothetical protein